MIGLSTFALPCIGTHQAGRDSHLEPDYLQLKHEMAIKAKNDTFAYRGTVYSPWETSVPKISIALNGRFTSPTAAKVTLTVHYRSCGTQHFVLRRAPSPKLVEDSGTISYARSFTTTVADGCAYDGNTVYGPETVTDSESWRIAFSNDPVFPAGVSGLAGGATGPLTGSFEAQSDCPANAGTPETTVAETLSNPGTADVELVAASNGKLKVYTTSASIGQHGLSGTLTFGSGPPEPWQDTPYIANADSGRMPVVVASAGTTTVHAAVPWGGPFDDDPKTDALGTEPGTLSVTITGSHPVSLG